MKKNLLLLLASVIVTVSIAEVVLRVVGYERMTVTPLTGFHEYNGELGWKLIPDYKSRFVHRDFSVEMTTNSDGFRDDEYDVENKGGKVRVVSLGDSFTWGWGVEDDEVYMQVAESLLDGFEIINMGQNGYGTGQQLLLFNRYGKKYSPDLVTVGFVLNDIDDNISGRGKPLFDIVDGNLTHSEIPQQESLEIRVKSWLVKNSHLFVLANFGYERLSRWLKQKFKSSPNGRRQARYPRFAIDLDEEQDKKWMILEKILNELKRETGSEVLVFYIPNRIQIESDRSEYVDIVNAPETYDIDFPNKKLGEIAERNDVYYVDLVDRLRQEYEDGKKPYFEHDGHFSKDGHQIAGEELANALNEIFDGNN